MADSGIAKSSCTVAAKPCDLPLAFRRQVTAFAMRRVENEHPA